MSHKEEAFQFATPGEYTIKHVEGLPEVAPNTLRYSGNVEAPRQFVQPKEALYDPTLCTVLIDSDAGTIGAVFSEKDRDADTITGKLEADTALAELGINSDTKKYTSKELALKVKRLGHFFANKEDHISLLARLNNFSAKVTKFHEEAQANNGNAKKSLETVVEGFDPITFKLTAPLFKGGAKQSFFVEVGVDASSNSVLLFLDSPELYELDYNLRRELLGHEAEYFQQWGASVIYKS